MATKTQISKSGKRRQGHKYTIDYYGDPKTILDKYPREWEEVVFLEESGLKKKNGKPSLISHTRHIPR